MAKIGIALALYKPDLELLEIQLRSLAKQTRSDFFLAVYDDASIDRGSVDNLVAEIIGVGRSAVIYGSSRSGVLGAFEAALRALPECELIAFCDQDDEWEANKLEELAKPFSDPTVFAVHSDLSLVDRQGHKLAESCWRSENRDHGQLTVSKILMRNAVTGCALMFRRSLLVDILPIPLQTQPPPFYHDAWVALMALQRGKLVSLPMPLIRYRQHGGNAVGAEKKGIAAPKSVSGIINKCLIAFESRRILENLSSDRAQAKNPKEYSGRLDFGIPLFLTTIARALTASRGYLRIGLQLAAGKLFWDLGFRLPNKESQ